MPKPMLTVAGGTLVASLVVFIVFQRHAAMRSVVDDAAADVALQRFMRSSRPWPSASDDDDYDDYDDDGGGANGHAYGEHRRAGRGGAEGEEGAQEGQEEEDDDNYDADGDDDDETEADGEDDGGGSNGGTATAGEPPVPLTGLLPSINPLAMHNNNLVVRYAPKQFGDLTQPLSLRVYVDDWSWLNGNSNSSRGQYTDQLLQCDAQSNNGRHWYDAASTDKHRAQFASELLFHRYLLHSAHRVASPADADVVFLPFYAYVALKQRAQRNGRPMANHVMADWLRSPLWQVHGHNGSFGLPLFVFVVSHPAFHWSGRIEQRSKRYAWFDVALLGGYIGGRTVSAHNTVALCVEERPVLRHMHPRGWLPNWLRPRAAVASRTRLSHNIVVPYPQQHPLMVGDAAWHEAAANDRWDRRPVFVHFWGSFRAGTAARIRQAWLDGGRRLVGRRGEVLGSVADSNVDVDGDGNEDKMAAATAAAQMPLVVDFVDAQSESHSSLGEHYAAARRARYCFCPRGDTPTTRRLFDAVLALCVPVVASDDVSLPFDGLIDWGAFIVRVPERRLASGNDTEVDGVFDQLLALPESDWRRRHRAMLGARPLLRYEHVRPTRPTAPSRRCVTSGADTEDIVVPGRGGGPLETDAFDMVMLELQARVNVVRRLLSRSADRQM